MKMMARTVPRKACSVTLDLSCVEGGRKRKKKCEDDRWDGIKTKLIGVPDGVLIVGDPRPHKRGGGGLKSH